MAEFPSMPVWIDSYWADTFDLDAEQHGIYLNLLFLIWRQPGCKLVADHDFIKKFFKAKMGMHGRTYNAKVVPIIERFMNFSEGFYTQKRLLKEYEKRVKKSRKESENTPNPTFKIININDLDIPDDAEQSQFEPGLPSPSPSPSRLSEDDNLSNPPKIVAPEKPKTSSPKTGRRAHSITKGWIPNETYLEAARHAGLSADVIAAELIKFRQWYIDNPDRYGHAIVKFDWFETWHRWCERAAARISRPTSGGANSDGVGKETKAAFAAAQLARGRAERDAARDIELDSVLQNALGTGAEGNASGPGDGNLEPFLHGEPVRG